MKLKQSFLHSSSFWSAIAGISAAIAAFMSYSQHNISLTQQQLALINSVRPVLIFDDWEFTSDSNKGTIKIGSIENIGIAPARFVRLEMKKKNSNKKIAEVVFVMDPISIIAVGERKVISDKAIFWWEFATAIPKGKIMFLELTLTYLDINGNRHEQVHSLTAFSEKGIGAGAEMVAPDLYLISQKPSIYEGNDKIL